MLAIHAGPRESKRTNRFENGLRNDEIYRPPKTNRTMSEVVATSSNRYIGLRSRERLVTSVSVKWGAWTTTLLCLVKMDGLERISPPADSEAVPRNERISTSPTESILNILSPTE
jgi:hypothetical protein